jgi:hypothetical protein
MVGERVTWRGERHYSMRPAGGQALALVLEPIQTLPPTVGADEW